MADALVAARLGWRAMSSLIVGGLTIGKARTGTRGSMKTMTGKARELRLVGFTAPSTR
jgi:hypothetical protein